MEYQHIRSKVKVNYPQPKTIEDLFAIADQFGAGVFLSEGRVYRVERVGSPQAEAINDQLFKKEEILTLCDVLEKRPSNG